MQTNSFGKSKYKKSPSVLTNILNNNINKRIRLTVDSMLSSPEDQYNALPTTDLTPLRDKITPDYQGCIFAKTQFFGKNKDTYAVSYDWISFTAMSNPECFSFAGNEEFELKLLETGTQHFFETAQIIKKMPGADPEVCAIMELKPRPRFLDPNLVKIKIENKYLYQEESAIISLINAILKAFKLSFKNYTRIDVCADFQRISENEHFGKDTIEQTMRHFAAMKYVVKGKSMETYHERNRITGITWGRRSSGMCITMYNKTVYMKKQGNNKPHIKKLWDEAGFDSKFDTYRLEFSEGKNLLSLCDEETGEILESHADIDYIKDVKRNFKSLYNKHFKLAVFCPGVRFSRMEKINLLDIDNQMITSKRLSEKKKCSNYTKAHIRQTFEDAVRYADEGEKIKASGLFEYIEDIIFKYDLQEWFNKHFPMFEIYEHKLTIEDVMLNNELAKRKLKHASIFCIELN